MEKRQNDCPDKRLWIRGDRVPEIIPVQRPTKKHCDKSQRSEKSVHWNPSKPVLERNCHSGSNQGTYNGTGD